MSDKEIKVVVTGDASGFEAATRKAANAAENLGSETEKAGAKAQKGLNEASASAKKASASFNELNGAMSALGAATALGVVGKITQSIADLGLTAVKSAAQLRQYEIGFQTMLGSAERGTKMLQDLQKFAAETPFDTKGTVNAAQKLMAYGFAAQEVIPMLRTVGDAAAGLSRGSEGVDRITLALGQMRAAGRLNSQDMKQLTEVGVNAWEFLAQASGKSVAEIRDATEKGLISSAKAVPVILAGLQAKFGGMMEQTAKEVTGLWNNIIESAGQAAGAIGAYITDALDIRGILSAVADVLNNMGQAFIRAREEGKSLTQAIADIIPPPVIAAAGALAAAIGATLVAAVTLAAGAIGSLLAPFAGIIAAAAAVGAGFTLLYTECETFRNIADTAFGAVVDVITTACKAMYDLVSIFTDSSKTIEQSFGEAVGYVLGLVAKMCEGAGELIRGFSDYVVDSLNETLTAAGYTGDSFIELISFVGEKAVNGLLEWFRGLPDRIANIFSSIKAGFRLSTSGAGISVEGYGGGGGDIGSSGDGKSAAEKFKSLLPNFGSVDLTGGDDGKGSKGGGGSEMDRLTQEINRVNEALEKAATKTTDLQSEFDKLEIKANFETLTGADSVFGQIKQQEQQRIQAIEDILTKQERSIVEAEKLRASAESTGDAEAIARAAELCEARKNLYVASCQQAVEMESAIHEQQQNKLLQLDTAVNAARAEAQQALNAATDEEFFAYLNSEQTAKLAALEEEQAYRQQMFDWQMESQQTLLDFGLQAAESLKQQLSSGIANCITNGESLAKTFQNIGKSIVNMFVQWIINRQLASTMNELFSKREQAASKAAAAADLAAWTPPAVAREIVEPGAAARATASVGTALAGAAAIGGFSSFGADNGSVGYHANGGIAHGWSIVGEEGPELVNFTNPGRVYTASETAAALNSGFGASGISAIQNIYGDINTGSDESDLFEGFTAALAAGVRGA